jgi:hypothetical protein
MALAGATASMTGPARAGASGCESVGAGALSANLSSGAVTRKVALEAGDVLNLSVQGASGAAASIALIEGAGAPRTLIGNSSQAAVSFQAPRSDTYTFSYSVSQGEAVIGASCVSAAAGANAAFLTRRKDLLNARDPDRIRIDRAPKPIANPDQPLGSSVALDDEGRPTQVTFSVSLSEIEAAANPGRAPQPGFVDLFLEGRMQNYATADLGETSGNLGVLYFGTRSAIGPDILVGGLAQLDRGVETTQYGTSEMTATGWMAGPYLSMRMASGVVFDGRVAWGQTEDASGLGEGKNETARELVRARLTGTRNVEGWSLAPSVGLVYVEDAIRDGVTGEVSAAGTGRVEVLPEVSRRFELDGDAFFEPRAAVGGYVGFEDLSALNSTLSPQALEEDMRLKAEAGVAVGVKDGSSLHATGAVESGVATAPETWSGRLQLNVPLGK